MGFLLPIVPLPRGQFAVEFLQYIASLLLSSVLCNSCHTLPHCPGAVDSRNFFETLPPCPRAVGSGAPAPVTMHCFWAWRQRAVLPLHCTASLT